MPLHAFRETSGSFRTDSTIVNDLIARVRDLQRQGGLTLPLPGRGRTADRHRRLVQFARMDLSLARIAEAHADAIAILAEQHREGDFNALYTVWAGNGPHGTMTATPLPHGRWRLDGVKQYCSGATLADAALVTADAAGGVLLFEVPLDVPGVSVLPSSCASPAISDPATVPVAFAQVVLPAAALIGELNWYLKRPGFWHGAIGPAACWAGGTLSLIDAAIATDPKDGYSRARIGALEAIEWGLLALLDQSGVEIDADPTDEHRTARRRALNVRHLVERWSTEVMDRFSRATASQRLAFSHGAVGQYTALTVYIQQCHGERDLGGIRG